MTPNPETWLYPTPNGLFCEPGGFFIDPHRPVERAIITHGHSDHARPGHGAVMATPETVAIMKVRLGDRCAGSFQPTAYGATTIIGGVGVRLVPAGHILGAAQVVLDWAGCRIVASGDYKRQSDPTTAGFEVVRCDVFISEATFGLPVFRHPPPATEVAKLLHSLSVFPDRAHLVGVYGLGKCQRLIALIREAGYDAPIHVSRSFLPLIDLYRSFGASFGEIVPVAEPSQRDLAGKIVLVPSGSADGRWLTALDEPVTAQASGWMRIRNRARASAVELPLIISDHADWRELLETIEETGAGDIWVTHGRDDALTYQIAAMGRRGKALALVGRGEEGE